MEILTTQDFAIFEIGITQKTTNEKTQSLYLRTIQYRNFQDYLLYNS